MPGPTHVTVTEVGPRDGFQIEPEFIPTETKIELIDELVDAGIRVIEFSSFVSPRAVPQLADAAEVLKGIDRSKGARFAALVPNAKGAERAAEAGVDEIRVFVSASESHNRKNVNRSIEESLERLRGRDADRGRCRHPGRGRDRDLVWLPVRGRGAGRAGGLHRQALSRPRHARGRAR